MPIPPTVFGLPRDRVINAARAVRQTSRDALSDTNTDDARDHIDTFARAAWSSIVEPGDSTASELINILGATAALDALVRDESAHYWASILLERHAGDLDSATTLDGMHRALERWQPRLVANRVLDLLERAQRTETLVLGPFDHEWPLALNDLRLHTPLCLWVRGNLDTIESARNSVALVGARASTRYGEEVTLEIASGLAVRGYCLVSGAAYGIDAIVHRSAFASHGQTIAIVAGGADRPYPSGHADLLARVVRDGAVISEVPNGTAPTRWRFLQRNRLIAALTRGTVVMEAGQRSGSLNTANHAASLGRPLGAVPGPVTSTTSAGCHRLIRDYAAALITDVDTVVELIEPLTGPSAPAGVHPRTDADTRRGSSQPPGVEAVEVPGGGSGSALPPEADNRARARPGINLAASGDHAGGASSSAPGDKTAGVSPQNPRHTSAGEEGEGTPTAEVERNQGGAEAINPNPESAAPAVTSQRRTPFSRTRVGGVPPPLSARARAVESVEVARVRDSLSRRRPRSAEEIAVDSGLSHETVRSALGLLAVQGEIGGGSDGWTLRDAEKHR
ncbi:DNA-protecting protein DprA [Mycetocola tolaasinivorans]|uniref:DNA-protecting protein DprA n=1 Tax=Mycetocola tolaasinivorans TaxID=76635 RepID=A0A3L7A4A4_9MICO|nr:DNA-processing protein DprA [Mycetocola tolaasinivorans]RLP75037.1 DNA-protecting protein DprA [Mycetocola tolaasinivorans]